MALFKLLNNIGEINLGVQSGKITVVIVTGILESLLGPWVRFLVLRCSDVGMNPPYK